MLVGDKKEATIATLSVDVEHENVFPYSNFYTRPSTPTLCHANFTSFSKMREGDPHPRNSKINFSKNLTITHKVI